MKQLRVFAGLLFVGSVAALAAAFGGRLSASGSGRLPLPLPTIGDYEQLTSSTTPPTEAQCFTANSDSGGRRCFTPQSMRAAYNVDALNANGDDGSAQTIAVIDALGSDTVAHDLHVFDQAFGVQPMCGEEGVTCASGMPTFGELSLQGSSAETKAHPGKGHGLQDKSGWALEVSLDVEWAHAIAPARTSCSFTPLWPRRSACRASRRS